MEIVILAALLLAVVVVWSRLRRTEERVGGLQAAVDRLGGNLSKLEESRAAIEASARSAIEERVREHLRDSHRLDLESIPECAALPDCFEIRREWPQEAFEARLEQQTHDALRHKTTLRCSRCGQVWQVDDPSRHDEPLAMKVRTPWSKRDERQARVDYLRRRYGGESDEKCVIGGCEQNALLGVAFCARHAYARRSKATD